MDLSLPVDNIRLNIRVSVILETPRGIIFEYDKHDFYYPVGGRLKIGEESAEAAVRELYEELQLKTDRSQLSFCGIIEDFYSYDSERYHEINFVYITGTGNIAELPDGFSCLSRNEIDRTDIRPAEFKELMSGQCTNFRHLVIHDESEDLECSD